LAEVDARKLHLSMGSSSLFDYCLKRLGLSNNEAFHRITAARLGRRFPVIFEMLERRDVHLTAVCLLRDCLTPENHAELLREASHKTKTELEELLARRFPQANGPSRLRKLPSFEPRSEGQYLLQLNASAALKQKLELTRDLMSHANPSGDLAVVVERALDALIERLQSRRFARTKSVRASGTGHRLEAAMQADSTCLPGPSAVRASQTDESSAKTLCSSTPQRAHLRNEVRRAVVARDGHRCSFVGKDGQRCEGHAFLQFHHQRAWALGGADTTENLSLMCRAHNRLLAERELGAERIAQAIERTRHRS
jgi:5-methylcytosine-specific restriction endonuclease McrA